MNGISLILNIGVFEGTFTNIADISTSGVDLLLIYHRLPTYLFV